MSTREDSIKTIELGQTFRRGMYMGLYGLSAAGGKPSSAAFDPEDGERGLG
jgi:hypothetical protein